MALHIQAITGTIFVIYPRQEGFYRLHIGFLHSCKLPKLQHPISLQFLRPGLITHVRKGKAVRKPRARQLCKERGLSNPLRPVQDQHTVKFRTRLVNPCYRCRQCFADDCPGIFRVLRAKVIRKNRINPFCPIPLRQAVKVFLYRMVCPLRSNRKQGILCLGRRINSISFVQIYFQGCKIRVVPSGLDLLPRQTFPGVDPVPVQVKCDRLQIFVMTDSKHQIFQSVFYFPLSVQIQLFLPFLRLLKLRLRRLLPLPCQRQLHVFIMNRKLAHSLKRRQFYRIRILRCFPVLLAKLVYPHNVKSIHQLAAGRVRGMVGISKLPFINHHTCLGIRRDIIKPPRHCTCLVHIRQELCDCFFNGIRPAERPDHSIFFKRVRLLLHLPLHYRLLPAAYRPLGRIPPILIP